MSILIKNAVILTADENNTVIDNGYIAIEGKYIQYIGKDLPSFQADQVIDAKGGIAMPGLVNAHTHMAMTYFRSYASDLPLQQWLESIWKIEDKLNDEFVYYGTALACIEALEGGTACINDMYFFMDAAAKACADTGIRAYLGRGIMDVTGDAAQRLEEAEALIDKHNGNFDGTINILVSPHAEYTCSEELLKRCTDLAKKKNVRLHIHLSETDFETNDCIQRRGKTPVQFLADAGVFEVPTIAAHCVTLNDTDMELLKKYNVTAVHNPASNLKLGSGIAPVPQMLDKGINVALGTDGAGSNNNLDMFREMLLAALIHKGSQRNAALVNANTALRMATANGARALGYDGGCLKAGSLADVIVLKHDSLSLMPLHDAAGIAVYSGTKSDVALNIVNGKVVVFDGKCVTIDKAFIISQFKKCVQTLFNV